MFAVLVLGNHAGWSLLLNVVLMTSFVIIGLVVPRGAAWVYSLRGWRRIVANGAMTLAMWIAALVVMAPRLSVLAKLAVDMGCYCLWGWEAWCCYF